jgi:hypothetical protein
MLTRLLKSLRGDIDEEEFVEIKSKVIENFMIRDLETQVEFLKNEKKGLLNRLKELEAKLEVAIQEKEEYCDKYIKADTDNFNQVVRNAKQQAEINNLIFRLQKYEGSPPE